MAKKSKIVANEKRKALVEQYRERRDVLRSATKDTSLSMAQRQEAGRALAKLPVTPRRAGSATGTKPTGAREAISARRVYLGSTFAPLLTAASYQESRSRVGKRLRG